ncbi:MAG: nucleotidyltransferase substrate binding protein [Methanimicrococcus sp.]|nr:nucleotidyltransferase substrate binding protein [Methanimicrococcus sp.]
MSIRDTDIRWKQRFSNYSRAFLLLQSALEDKDIDQYSLLEIDGITQLFEYTFDLGWKTFKDYLVFCGAAPTVLTPRGVIKECAIFGLFNDAGINGDIYLDMMVTRNDIPHMYDLGESASVFAAKIKSDYLQELEKEYLFFMNKELKSGAE